MEKLVLTGQLVRLRALEPDDAHAQWRWNNDPEVMRWIEVGYPESLAQLTARCEARETNSYGMVLLGIETLADDRLVGLVRLSGAAPHTGDAELDVYLGEKDSWGHGYGTEAVRLICRYGFELMRLHRITLWVADQNAAAIRVYQKVGFVEEGRARQSFRRDGKWHDMIMMGLLEGELLG